MEISPAAASDPYAPPQSDSTPEYSEEVASLIAQVRSGVRFYLVPYVFSVVFMSFRKNMGDGVHRIERDEWPTGQVVGATLITGLFGWWGIPWGFIWSVPTLIHLWNGGRDLTPAMLKEAVGRLEAKHILAAAQKPKKPPLIWLVRLVVLAALSFPAWLVFIYVKYIL